MKQMITLFMFAVLFTGCGHFCKKSEQHACNKENKECCKEMKECCKDKKECKDKKNCTAKKEEQKS